MTTPHRTTMKTCLLGAMMTLMAAVPSAAMAQHAASKSDSAGKRVERERPPRDSVNRDDTRLFNNLDTNKDGSISQDEFLSRHKERFKALDTNNDGKISADEFKAQYERKRPSMADQPNAGTTGKAPAKK